ncbi:hypothetical protein BP00DRAFT_150898 [Aspergillus indologenus CBS 114.80]|uniref:Uncharacterized protein n=1 Tax=Aspergillus indologenus CBS 114.80 TaxID=1450541 RepID=A0A2V5II06_9EURO|nr:hypothetical protein BP00DRAFT_150898 [Aspergillus indologenus CBS 114.80]
MIRESFGCDRAAKKNTKAFLRLRRHRREGEQESQEIDAEAKPPTVARSPLVDKSAGYASLRGPCVVTCRGIGRSSTRECCPSALGNSRRTVHEYCMDVS